MSKGDKHRFWSRSGVRIPYIWVWVRKKKYSLSWDPPGASINFSKDFRVFYTTYIGVKRWQTSFLITLWRQNTLYLSLGSKKKYSLSWDPPGASINFSKDFQSLLYHIYRCQKVTNIVSDHALASEYLIFEFGFEKKIFIVLGPTWSQYKFF